MYKTAICTVFLIFLCLIFFLSKMRTRYNLTRMGERKSEREKDRKSKIGWFCLLMLRFCYFFYYLQSNKRVRLYCYHFRFANGNFCSSVIKRLFYFISLLIRIIIWNLIPVASEINDGNVLLLIGTKKKYIYRYSIILLILYRNVYDVRLLKYLLKRSRVRGLEIESFSN